MLAIARQRKETKEVERVSHSRVDKVTSHWWKGVLSLEGGMSYDEHRKQPPTNGKSYQQQLETQIQLSQKHGVVLALPALCDRLNLSTFEKNLILMSLAPEVNRRYARLYRYLQGEDVLIQSDLPTVDLVLRLLCRNDAEWRDARLRLASSPLQQFQLCHLLPGVAHTFLNQPIKLTEPLLNYLLSTQPNLETLDALLTQPPTPLSPGSSLETLTPTIAWSDLILPPPLLEQLQGLSQIAQIAQMQPGETGTGQIYQPGRVILFAGVKGTGKTSAAEAIAHALNLPLIKLDLALVKPEDYAQVLQEITSQSPSILLIQSAQYWLRRSALISPIDLNRLLVQRKSRLGLLLLTVEKQQSVSIHWQRQIDQILVFPLPNPGDRLKLWQQSFPPHIELSSEIDWAGVAKRLALSGGEIRAIAQTATLHLANTGETTLSLSILQQSLQQHNKSVKLQPLQSTPAPPQPKPTRKRKSR